MADLATLRKLKTLTNVHTLGQVFLDVLAAAVLADLALHGVQLSLSAAQLHIELCWGADVGHANLLTVACTLTHIYPVHKQ